MNDNVNIQNAHSKLWSKVKILAKCQEPRSYRVSTNEGLILRRTEAHMKHAPIKQTRLSVEKLFNPYLVVNNVNSPIGSSNESREIVQVNISNNHCQDVDQTETSNGQTETDKSTANESSAHGNSIESEQNTQ